MLVRESGPGRGRGLGKAGEGARGAKHESLKWARLVVEEADPCTGAQPKAPSEAGLVEEAASRCATAQCDVPCEAGLMVTEME